eukprot:TRINITY_DN2093_c0_g1_i1.p1 TRINITY_DN2093_c0_g1~~TRINITY_DN2093_c0_g1_i1.p1  ORF type:complete len:1374 (-),score=363.63 TRINITY_DN2093_c0_g1_i1:7-4128(-)
MQIEKPAQVIALLNSNNSFENLEGIEYLSNYFNSQVKTTLLKGIFCQNNLWNTLFRILFRHLNSNTDEFIKIIEFLFIYSKFVPIDIPSGNENNKEKIMKCLDISKNILKSFSQNDVNESEKKFSINFKTFEYLEAIFIMMIYFYEIFENPNKEEELYVFLEKDKYPITFSQDGLFVLLSHDVPFKHIKSHFDVNMIETICSNIDSTYENVNLLHKIAKINENDIEIQRTVVIGFIKLLNRSLQELIAAKDLKNTSDEVVKKYTFYCKLCEIIGEFNVIGKIKFWEIDEFLTFLVSKRISTYFLKPLDVMVQTFLLNLESFVKTNEDILDSENEVYLLYLLTFLAEKYPYEFVCSGIFRFGFTFFRASMLRQIVAKAGLDLRVGPSLNILAESPLMDVRSTTLFAKAPEMIIMMITGVVSEITLNFVAKTLFTAVNPPYEWVIAMLHLLEKGPGLYTLNVLRSPRLLAQIKRLIQLGRTKCVENNKTNITTILDSSSRRLNKSQNQLLEHLGFEQGTLTPSADLCKFLLDHLPVTQETVLWLFQEIPQSVKKFAMESMEMLTRCFDLRFDLLPLAMSGVEIFQSMCSLLPPASLLEFFDASIISLETEENKRINKDEMLSSRNKDSLPVIPTQFLCSLAECLSCEMHLAKIQYYRQIALDHFIKNQQNNIQRPILRDSLSKAARNSNPLVGHQSSYSKDYIKTKSTPNLSLLKQNMQNTSSLQNEPVTLPSMRRQRSVSLLSVTTDASDSSTEDYKVVNVEAFDSIFKPNEKLVDPKKYNVKARNSWNKAKKIVTNPSSQSTLQRRISMLKDLHLSSTDSLPDLVNQNYGSVNVGSSSIFSEFAVDKGDKGDKNEPFDIEAVVGDDEDTRTNTQTDISDENDSLASAEEGFYADEDYLNHLLATPFFNPILSTLSQIFVTFSPISTNFVDIKANIRMFLSLKQIDFFNCIMGSILKTFTEKFKESKETIETLFLLLQLFEACYHAFNDYQHRQAFDLHINALDEFLYKSTNYLVLLFNQMMKLRIWEKFPNVFIKLLNILTKALEYEKYRSLIPKSLDVVLFLSVYSHCLTQQDAYLMDLTRFMMNLSLNNELFPCLLTGKLNIKLNDIELSVESKSSKTKSIGYLLWLYLLKTILKTDDSVIDDNKEKIKIVEDLVVMWCRFSVKYFNFIKSLFEVDKNVLASRVLSLDQLFKVKLNNRQNFLLSLNSLHSNNLNKDDSNTVGMPTPSFDIPKTPKSNSNVILPSFNRSNQSNQSPIIPNLNLNNIHTVVSSSSFSPLSSAKSSPNLKTSRLSAKPFSPSISSSSPIVLSPRPISRGKIFGNSVILKEKSKISNFSNISKTQPNLRSIAGLKSHSQSIENYMLSPIAPKSFD